MMKAVLSKKDESFRDFSLNGPVWRVVLYVSLPLAFYQSLNQLFKLLDAMIAAHISSSAVSTVAYLSQINMSISALGSGLAVGASIKVSEAYGAGDLELVKKRVNTMFALCAALGGGLLLLFVPNTSRFLRLMNTPEEFIRQGSTYFILELFGLVITFFNNIYIAVERARGNSGRILRLNLLTVLAKLGLTAWFVYILEGGIQMISIATILSQSMLLLAALFHMYQPGNAFSFSIRAVSFQKKAALPMVTLSLPVIVEKFAFSLGKVVVNSMSTLYGAVPLGIHAAVTGLLYGIGKTNITLFMNICRVFVFRIPVLWALQKFTGLGSDCAGIVMAISNIGCGLLAVLVLIKIKKEKCLLIDERI